jgi:short-subunit dehydrogenase involved in D-alanine esterification of teichoic acids
VSGYPDLDCVILNSGVQTQIRLSRPAEVDLDAFHSEMSTNFSRLVDLSVKFLPHLLQKSYPTALAFTGSLLASVPAVTVPAYSASKAALSAYAYCLRRQNQGTNTKVIEIWPPAVQSRFPSLFPSFFPSCGHLPLLTGF